MYGEIRIHLGNLLLSLSDAMDLASPAIASHGLRTAFIAWEVARRTELPERQIEDLFIASLLHDVGALSVREKELIHAAEELHPELHCVKGAFFLSRIPFLQHLAPIVRHHHRPRDEWLHADSSKEAHLAQILMLADTVERSIDRKTYILSQSDRIRTAIKQKTGTVIHADLIDIFIDISRREEFWLDLASPKLYLLLLQQGPHKTMQIGLKEIIQISEMFRDIIDFRSKFTATHSSGVATSAAHIAKAFGMTPAEVQLMEVAGNVHDLGKLAVPDAILEKPGPLTESEFQHMKIHTYFTYSILKAVGGLERIPEWAAFHHERLDGAGYPFRLGCDNLDSGARILAVADIFTALLEDRPYRNGMNKDRIIHILDDMATSRKLDANIVQLLSENMREISIEVQDRQTVMREYYEERFRQLDDCFE